MKICVVTTVFPRWPGDGEGAFVWQQVQQLRQQHLDVCVVAMHSQGAASFENFDGVPVFRPPYWWPTHHELLRKEGGGLPINLRRYRLAWAQLAPFAVRHALATLRTARGCDVVHAHFTLSAAIACLGQAVHRCPVVATVHGSDIFQVPKLPGGAWFTRHALLPCARITTVSRALYDETVRLGVPSAQVQVISNGVDVTQFAPPATEERQNLILFAGSLIKRKGVEYLLRAMPSVLQAAANIRLVIIGDGPERPSLEALAQRLGIAPQVTFLGFQPPDQLRQWMQRARIFVLPSVEEGQGVVLLEALACGTPLVGSRVGGIPEVINESVGELTPPADAPALARALVQILANPTRWATMSANARQLALAQYDSREMARRYVQLYQSLIR